MYSLKLKPIMYSPDLLFFYSNVLIKDDINKKAHLFLIEPTFFQVGDNKYFRNWFKTYQMTFT